MLVLFALLAGCQQEYAPVSVGVPFYNKSPPLKLDVTMIRHEVLPQDPVELKAPLLIKPEQALQDWAKQRLRAEGKEGIAVIILRHYDLREVRLDGPERSLLTRLTSLKKERIEAEMDVAVEFYDDDNVKTDEVAVSVNHAHEFEHEITYRERLAVVRKEIFELLDALELTLSQYYKWRTEAFDN